GGVHAHDDHLVALATAAEASGVRSVYVHLFLDGRDTPPRSALGYLADLEVRGQVRRVAEARRAHPDATIAELGERLHLTRSSVQRCLHWLERQAATLPRQALP
ncbi:MAG: hypothetical protein ACKO8K_07560, partial [Candidatus Limnocylindrus sp.]